MPLPSACLKVRPMAITSPTLFICVPSTGSAPGNFSNCQRGIFDDDVIDGRLETGGRLARDVVLDFVQAIADGELRGDLGDGESGGLRRQRGAARDARVHLDDHHAAGLGIDGELDVGAAGIDADFAQAGQRGVAHHLIFAIGERLRGGDGDGIAGVHAHRDRNSRWSRR